MIPERYEIILKKAKDQPAPALSLSYGPKNAYCKNKLGTKNRAADENFFCDLKDSKKVKIND